MDIDTRSLVITVSDVRPATPEQCATFGFVPCKAAILGLPEWWGELSLWVAEHQDFQVPLLAHEKVVAKMMTDHQTVDVVGQLVSIPGQLSFGERTSRFFPTWFQVDDVNDSEITRVWVEHVVMVHGGLRNGMVPVRFGVSPAPLWIRATTLPPPPKSPATMRAKLMINRYIRSGLELRSLMLYGHLTPYGVELPENDQPRPKPTKTKATKATKKPAPKPAVEPEPAATTEAAEPAPAEPAGAEPTPE